jgi:hypothetical protein
MITKI